VVYVLLRLPTLSEGPLTSAELFALTARLLSFGIIGILGGELFVRLRYNLASLEGQSALDDWSRVFNQRYIHAELVRAMSRHARYGEPLSVVIITISQSVFSGCSPSRQRSVVRGIADHIRSDVRVVDEVGRLADGRFVVLLPHTPAAGGGVVRERIAVGVRSALGARAEAIAVGCLSLPEDDERLKAFVDSIAPEVEEDQPEASGLYSSSADSDLKPASASTRSAAGSSTLNTSTAASPEGSTKQ